ncbi:MAG: class I adenylate-forming enzyme family protein [Acidimicrobiales bacterium]
MPKLIALDMPAGERYVAAIQEAWNNGDAVMPIDRRLPPDTLRQLIDVCRPTDVRRDDGELITLASGIPVDEGDALVMPTSGTSARPKGVVLAMDALVASARMTSARLSVDPDTDTWLACLPLSHIGGFTVITKALFNHTPLRIFEGFDARLVDEEARKGATLVSLVPTAMRRVDTRQFRIIVLGGSMAPDDLPSNAVATYGMTETGSGCVYGGTPLDGIEIAVRDSNGNISFHGSGEVLVRGPVLLRCYRDGSVPLSAEGWLPTGDSGWIAPGNSLKAQGTLHVTGRISEIINTGGEKVAPEQVERVLATHDSVREVAVIGKPDPQWGERVVAYVVPKDQSHPPTLESLAEMVKSTLAPWAAPKELVLLASMPKTPLSKIARTVLKQSALNV